MALGRVLRQTRRVRRGLGSIRQDLNVSIGAGIVSKSKAARTSTGYLESSTLRWLVNSISIAWPTTCEPCSTLPALPSHRDVDDSEIEHQVAEAVKTHLPLTLQDVSGVFSSTDSGMVADGLANGAVVLALPLKGLLGRLGSKSMDEEGAQLPRLRRELAGAAKLAGVKGIFHADELAYGITSEEVAGLREAMNLAEDDAYVLCCAPQWQATLALEGRPHPCSAGMAPYPTRSSKRRGEKGRTRRRDHLAHAPTPGRSRMYPETDVPPQVLSTDAWQAVLASLPMSDTERSERLNGYDMSADQSSSCWRELDDVFCDHVGDLPAKAWAALLLNHDDQHPQTLANILQLREDGTLARTTSTVLLRRITAVWFLWKHCEITAKNMAWLLPTLAVWRTSSKASLRNGSTLSRNAAWALWAR